MLCARLCQSASRFLCHEYASFTWLRCFQGRNYALDNTHNKEESFNPSEEKTSRDSVPSRLTAKWKWVVRGKYKVAAFSADNNPAVAIANKLNNYQHSHKCSNCQTVYEHTHPYGSLHHPQHIKDCPKCKVLAPADLEIK